jgi:hypothetical protein
MELEGLGVSLVGRNVWYYKPPSHFLLSGIPWEFIQGTNYSMRIYIHGGGHKQIRIAEAERPWTCIWSPSSQRDWSCLATIVRSIGTGSCLIVFDHVVGIPHTFWSFLDTVQREGRILVTRVWIHTDAPQWIPDAVFFPPLETSAPLVSIADSLPARNGHGGWRHGTDWEAIVQATRDQQLGLVLTDVEESDWTLLWHKPEDSKQPMDVRIPRATQWIETGTALLK